MPPVTDQHSHVPMDIVPLVAPVFVWKIDTFLVVNVLNVQVMPPVTDQHSRVLMDMRVMDLLAYVMVI